MKLSTRIALSAALVVPLLVLGAGLLMLPLVSRDLHHQQDVQLNTRATAVKSAAQALLVADHQGRPKAEQNQHRRVTDAALQAGVRVVAQDGTVVDSVGPQPATLPPPQTATTPVTIRADGQAWRVLAVHVNGADPGTAWLIEPTAELQAQVNAVSSRVLLVALVSAPLSGLIGFGLASRATRSLRRVSHQASELDPRTGAVAFNQARTGTAEVDELAAAIGLLLARYDEQAGRTAQALETARSFSSAASHELRTPLMSMRTNLDVLAGHPDLPVGERAEVVGELQHDHARLLELLTALRTLARGDLVEVSAFAPLDLAELVDASVGEAARRHPGAVVAAELPSEMRVFGWEAGLRIMVDNLITNATVHGHRPGEPPRITVRLAMDGPSAVLTVDDEGPGIPAAERAQVFHRFHRRPDSPGSGLGLTLVAQQAALHRGTVAAGTPPTGTGCRIEIRLPLLRPDAPTTELPARRDWLSVS
jgi:two-component system sensor histidine kinase PrrB